MITDKLLTEKRNEKTQNLDMMTSKEVMKVINEEDKKVAESVEEITDKIAEVVDLIGKAFLNGGRLIYIGAGTSGRLGVLDAVECVPTFGVPPEKVVGLIAGGEKAFVRAVEGAEDSKELAVEDLKSIGLNSDDILVGIAASGRTPYVIGGLEYGNSIGVETVAVSCNKGSKIGQVSNYPLEVEVGPEVLTGSTRLKSGTAQKLILNMLSTGSMIRYGKVYGNLMVDVKATNEKLVERSKKIIMEGTGVAFEEAERYFLEAKEDVKRAIVMIKCRCSCSEAKEKLEKANGFIREAIK